MFNTSEFLCLKRNNSKTKVLHQEMRRTHSLLKTEGQWAHEKNMLIITIKEMQMKLKLFIFWHLWLWHIFKKFRKTILLEQRKSNLLYSISDNMNFSSSTKTSLKFHINIYNKHVYPDDVVTWKNMALWELQCHEKIQKSIVSKICGHRCWNREQNIFTWVKLLNAIIVSIYHISYLFTARVF